MQPRFHHEALQRLSVQYEPDPAAMGTLDARAAALGIRFPSSLVELYGMRGAAGVLRRLMGDDDPIGLEHLGRSFEWRWPAPRDCLAEGLLPFLFENQAVCLWALRLDGSDDPPVLVARDPDLDWRPCAATFSGFVAGRAWERVGLWDGAEPGGRRILLEGQDRPLRAGDLRFLRQWFEALPATQGWPGEHQYRFQRDDARILVWDGEGQADWFISETSEARLEAVLGELWSLGDLRSSLWSNDKRGERVLARKRG